MALTLDDILSKQTMPEDGLIDYHVTYNTIEREREKAIEYSVKKFFSNKTRERQKRSKMANTISFSREDLYEQAKNLRLEEGLNIAYLSDLSKNALLEHSALLELALDYAINEVESEDYVKE
jgi:hypothetical protein